MNPWPHLDYLSWRGTCSALHLYLQIVGKYRLAHTPWLNHSWNATFYVTPIGLTTSPIPDGPGIEVLSIFASTGSWAPAATVAKRRSSSRRPRSQPSTQTS